MLPGQPGDGQEDQGDEIGCGRAFLKLTEDTATPAVDGHDGGHLQGVEQDGGNGAGRRHEPDPEGRGDVEAQKSGVEVPEGVSHLVLTQQPVELEERDEGDQGKKSQPRDEEGEAGQDDETDDQQPEVSFGI